MEAATAQPIVGDRRAITRAAVVAAGRSPLSPVFAVAAVVVVGSAALGIGSISAATRTFPFDVLALFVALEAFSCMVVATGAADRLAVGMTHWSRGRRARTMVAGVVLLIATCAVGNNLTHVGLVLPVLLVVLGALNVDRRYATAYLALVVAVINLAGAATPIGDFPALLILDSGMTSFGAYLAVAFPLFGLLSAGSLLAVYLLMTRRRTPDAPIPEAPAPLPTEASVALLTARFRHTSVDIVSLRRLLTILACMFAGWIFSDVPPWAIAWAGLGVAGVAVQSVGRAARISGFDLGPAVRIGAFLGVASWISTTGGIEAVAALLQGNFHEPLALVVMLMVAVAAVTAIVSAGPAAAVMLPLAQTLVAAGGPLEGRGDLTAIAFAAAICAGSSMFLTSATAGLYMQSKIAAAGLRDRDGRPLLLTFREYVGYGALNAAVQLTIGIAAVVVLFSL